MLIWVVTAVLALLSGWLLLLGGIGRVISTKADRFDFRSVLGVNRSFQYKEFKRPLLVPGKGWARVSLDFRNLPFLRFRRGLLVLFSNSEQAERFVRLLDTASPPGATD
jgi:hypothetical protein